MQRRQLYDGFGRLVENDIYEPGGTYIAATQGYDALGRLSSVTNPSESGDGLNYPTIYAYDGMGRVIKVTAQDGSITTTGYTTYNDNSILTTDAQG